MFANRTYLIATKDESLPAPKQSRPAAVPASSPCHATVPGASRFVPPEYPAHAPYPDFFWHGTPSLWTMLPVNGRWPSLPHGVRGYRQKLFVWRPGYDGRTEQWPALTVTGRRLDGDAEPAFAEEATNAYNRDFGGWAMLTAVEVPTHGCWELTATYRDSTLTFVVSVIP